MPPMAAHLEQLVERYPDAMLIVAHGGIADLAALSEAFAGKAGVFFDSSMWSPVDLLDLFSRVPPEQILYASDYPYGSQPGALTLLVRTARRAGLDDRRLRDVLGRSAARIAAGEPPLEPTRPVGPGALEQPLTLLRIHHYLAMATPLLWTRQPDTTGALGLALNACAERDGSIDARERIAELLTCACELWRLAPELEDEGERWRQSRVTLRLVHLAAIVAITSGN
jgi:hypothetical protein